MRLCVALCFLACVVLSCKKRRSTLFLQQREIRISPPRLQVSNQLVDSAETLTASLKLEGTTIRFTVNGDIPTAKSEVYKSPIKVFKPGIYKFKAFHPDWKESEVAEAVFYKKGLLVDTVIWHSKPSETYSGHGVMTLNNLQKASLDFKDVQWLGFDSIAKATLALKQKTYAKSLSIGYLSHPQAWIFPPESITVSTSKDGVSFKNKTVRPQTLDSMANPSLKNIEIPLGDTLKYIKIEVKNVKPIPKWHDGAGANAWLFMDEWILYAK